MNPFEQFIENLRDALAKGKLEDVLDSLLDDINEKGGKRNEVIIQSSRYHYEKKLLIDGQVLPAEFKTTCTNITNALLVLLDELRENDHKKSVQAADTRKPIEFGLDIERPATLEDALAHLNVNWKTLRLTELRLVNSDRFEEIGLMYNSLSERDDDEQEFQFYFLNACDMQKPESFAKRVILEIVEKMGEKNPEGISQPVELKSGPFAKLPFFFLGLNHCKAELATHFEKRVGFRARIDPSESVEQYLRDCVRSIMGIKYFVFVFNIQVSEICVTKEQQNLLLDYLRWIIETFTQIGKAEDLPTFLFFFPVFVRDLDKMPDDRQRSIADSIIGLKDIQDSFTTIISPLRSVPKDQVVAWFSSELGEADDEKVDWLLRLHLHDTAPKARRKAFEETGEIDMYDLEALQKAVYDYAQKQSRKNSPSVL